MTIDFFHTSVQKEILKTMIKETKNNSNKLENIVIFLVYLIDIQINLNILKNNWPHRVF